MIFNNFKRMVQLRVSHLLYTKYKDNGDYKNDMKFKMDRQIF